MLARGGAPPRVASKAIRYRDRRGL